MKRFGGCVAALMVALSTSSAFAESAAYACASYDNTGFMLNKDKNRFERTSFHDEKFTAIENGSRLTLRVDGREEVYKCEAPWHGKPNLLQCVEEFYFMTFDKASLRFVRALAYGYIAGSSDTLHIMYGDCQKF
ncbi:hypothetical protein [Aquamicrobium zhengzhouense]|uniref:Uncharacterized protein n=1 Tax=Aquamicrobium zhengzhouense TaxID=2781738 RepID=A0ABS0SAY6_9HYPH|nr:hypothetical protein [Aquamicrobium zhengzhouense]MBI1620450.1 hypothetical protein [Aquamicrobium zhengzhouense]